MFMRGRRTPCDDGNLATLQGQKARRGSTPIAIPPTNPTERHKSYIEQFVIGNGKISARFVLWIGSLHKYTKRKKHFLLPQSGKVRPIVSGWFSL